MQLYAVQQRVKMSKPKTAAAKTIARADPLQAFAAAAMPKCLCMNMRLATRRLVALYEARLEPSGLNISQFGIMIEMIADAENRRVRRVKLTPEGRKKLKRAGAAWAEAQAEAVEIVPPKLVEALLGATAKLPV
jgi:hypothetical protein